MLHSSTQTLLNYWFSLRHGKQVPSRQAFDPAHLSRVLPQLMMLGLERDRYPFRLSGGLLVRLHGHELRGLDFANLIAAPYRAGLREALSLCVSQNTPVVLSLIGRTSRNGTLKMQIPLAPLADDTGRTDRLVGLYQPLAPIEALDGDTLVSFALRSANLTQSANGIMPPHLRLAAVDGRALLANPA